MADKTDRRVLRTRRLLSSALLELLLEKEYDAITIQEITDRADLNRATFYLHYATKEELLVAGLEARFGVLVAQIEAAMGPHPSWEDATDILYVYRHVLEHSALYKVLLGERGRTYVVNRIIDYMTQFGVEGCREVYGDLSDLPVPLELVSRHMAGSLYALLSWWVLNDMPYPPEYMARLTHELCLRGVLQYVPALPALPAQSASGQPGRN